MTTFLALALLCLVLGVPWLLLERRHRRTRGLPAQPYGADAGRDADYVRLRHDLDVMRHTWLT